MRYSPSKGQLTYNHARCLLDHAASREKGKPLSNKWCRLFDHPTEKGSVLLRYCGHDFAIIRPNDDVVMLASPKYAQGTYKAFRIWLQRDRTDYYKPARQPYRTLPDEHPYWAPGTIINMHTGEISGPTKPKWGPSPARDPERGKAWTRKVAEYNKVWRVAAKLGEIERIIRESFAMRDSLGPAPMPKRIAEIIEELDITPAGVRRILYDRLLDSRWSRNEEHFYNAVLRGRYYYNNATVPEKLFSAVYRAMRKQVQEEKGLYQ